MDQAVPSPRREFLRSPHHVVLGVLTLGLGIASASALGLLVGAAAYALGWIYLPDMPFFRRWVGRKGEQARRAAEAASVAAFLVRRDALIGHLAPERRRRYEELADVSREIERASAENPLTPDNPGADPRLRKLDELMWTYLRLLGIEQSLEEFVANDAAEDVPGLLTFAQAEARKVSTEVEALKARGNGPDLDAKKRLLASTSERVGVLRKRLDRLSQAKENLKLVASERERLVQQVKLLRADAVATRNAEALTTRIDATVEHLDQTNRWLSELDEFKDLVGDLPATEARIGYEPLRAVEVPPPFEPEQRAAARERRRREREADR
jgi:hypothetical protein